MTNLTEMNTLTLNGPHFSPIKRVSVCDTQPVTAEGVRTLLGGSSDLVFAEASDSLAQAMDIVHRTSPDVLMLDKAFGIQAILEWLSDLKANDAAAHPTAIVVWGVSVTEAEALRFLQAGARGILRKTATIPAVLAC